MFEACSRAEVQRQNFELAAKIPTPRQGSHCEDEDVVIGMRVLPMGWAWSPFLAQLFTERTVEEAVPGAERNLRKFQKRAAR